MNSIILAVLIMMGLSLSRVPVILALIIGTLAGGLNAGMNPSEIISTFEGGLGNGATIALSYAMLVPLRWPCRDRGLHTCWRRR